MSGQQGNTRQYGVHVPIGYHGTPVPAVFGFHGLAMNAAFFCEAAGWPAKADQEGFVMIMPNGYQGSWNGGTCCGAAASAGLDDVALVRAIFAEVGKHVNIDLGRVYATGWSTGGYLSYRLACEASDLFVAVAPNSGGIGTTAIGGGTMSTSDLESCTPTQKVSILDIHGTSDPLVAYSLQAPSLAMYQGIDACSSMTTAATVPASGGDTTCVTFSGCPTCPNVEVTGCSIMGGGHCWYGTDLCVGNNSNFFNSTDAAWSFFAQVSR
ncbi:MAG TPA: PHB depolymerase family esterase [Polyangia bacterium]|nr:PHB depolymerase family esterase [Polyangia bacterium]